MTAPVVAVDLGDVGVAVSVDPAGGTGPLDRLEPVDVGATDGPVDLAAVFAPADGSGLVAGHEARRLAVTDPSRYEPSPRRRIDEGELLLGTRLVGVTEALGVVLTAALDRVGPLLRGARPRLLVLPHPEGWGRRRRETLRRAGSGLADELLLLPAPMAVAAYATWMARSDGRPSRAVAVLDAGADTVTASVVRPLGPDAGVLATRTARAGGGDDADEALLAHLVGALHPDDPARPRVTALVGAVALPDRRRRQVLLDDVRAAKERLSDAEQVSVPMPAGATAAWCSRRELEELLEPAVRTSVDLLADTLSGAGLAPADLDGVHLVGGGARLPLLGALVHRRLGVPPTVAPDPRLVVARGALAAVRLPRDDAARRPSAASRPEEIDPVRRAVATVMTDWPRARIGVDGPQQDGSAAPGADRAPGAGGAPDAVTAPVRIPRVARRPPPEAVPTRSRRRRLAAAGAVAAVLVAVAGALLAAGANSGGGAGSSAGSPATVVAFGHRYPLPSGWAPAGTDAAARRSQIRPESAPRGPDLVAVQEDSLAGLDPGAARGRIVERYGDTRAGGGLASDLDVDARFGGRDVVHYVQVPEPGTTVDWFVVFAGDLQLSVGCRADAPGRPQVLAACAEVVSGSTPGEPPVSPFRPHEGTGTVTVDVGVVEDRTSGVDPGEELTMTGQFGTSTEVMGTASHHVLEVNAQIQQQLATLRAQLAPLEGTWRGQASLSFQRLMVRWNEDAGRIGRALEAIGEDLAVSGRDYAATEQANTQTVTRISQALG